MKTPTFKTLYLSQAFTFASETEFHAMAKGPWVKVGARSYRTLQDGFAHGPTHIVGAVNVAVVPVA